MTSTIERCAFCGEIVSFDDDDVVQLHAGQNGMCHATCLRESENDTLLENGFLKS